MKSQLDILHWTRWFLEELNYFDFELDIILAEGLRSPEPDKNAPVPGARRVQVQPESRRYRVFFEYVLLFQVVDETHLKTGKKEKGTNGVLQKFEQSALLDYIKAAYEFRAPDKYNHYCIKTTNEFIDAVSVGKPIISEIRP